MTLAKIVWSWDFVTAFLVALSTIPFAPQWVRSSLVKDVSAIGISVLAITFSIFFAALAIIMSSSDDDFVAFLEADGVYKRVVSTFRFSLVVLSLALLFSLFLYTYTSARLTAEIQYQSRWWSIFFEFLFLYSLFAALTAALDSVRYSEYRSRFVVLRARECKKGIDRKDEE